MRFAIALLLAVSASAQVKAPLLGWLPESKQIREMDGLPGAAVLGSTMSVGRKLAHITVSPSQNYVLATDGSSGSVLLIIPGGSVTALGVPAKPDTIVVSPQGSSAALWYSVAGQFEVLSGLPGAVTTRQIDGYALNAPVSSMAVSDDGQWIAAGSSAGVLLWGPDGVARQVYSGGNAGALAFYTGLSELAVATSTQLLSLDGSAASVVYQGSFSPAGLGVSFDNRKIVVADRNGSIHSVDTAAHTAVTMDCGCGPSGVFGLGSAVFRLTSSPIGAVKLVDAEAGAILAVPRKGPETREVIPPQTSTQPLPNISINLSPVPTGYLQQPAMTVTSSSAYPVDIDGNVTLTFTSAESGTDNTIQFSNASTTVNFTIPAGSTQANFSGANSITFSTGTIAGTIVLTANVTAPTSASAVATQTVTTQPSAPVISSVTLSPSPGGIIVVVTGYSSTDEMTSATYLFALTSNATLSANDITVSVSPEFQTYYAATTSYATGSEFTLTVPFAIVGNPSDITGVTVTLLNNKGASNPVASK